MAELEGPRTSTLSRSHLPRRAKPQAETVLPIKSARAKGADTTPRQISNIPKRASTKDTSCSEDAAAFAQNFEFVTITGQPSQARRNETSRTVRTHAMRDYLRKQKDQATSGVVEVASVKLEEPSKYKGRFKLDTWSHKRTKSKAARTSSTGDRDQGVQSCSDVTGAVTHVLPTMATHIERWHDMSLQYPNSVTFVGTGSLDPFQCLAIPLGPRSSRLLVHYHSAYQLNSVAINRDGDFFLHAATDPALFHSILYLVALHLDLKQGSLNTPDSLYHGGEALKMINGRIDARNFSDITLAAIAMLATKENLNGHYDLARIHMRGLESIVKMRGGIHELKGLFQRIVAWSDLCCSNAWNNRPRFKRIDVLPGKPLGSRDIHPEVLVLSDIFDQESLIVDTFHNLRVLSSELAPVRVADVDRFAASNMIYNLEYGLLSMNNLQEEEASLSDSDISEDSPLRTAIHLYLYLVVRQVPPESRIINRMVERLRESLEPRTQEWWMSSQEKRIWLTWILFIGGATASGLEQWWFVNGLESIATSVGVWSTQSMEDCLRKVLWREDFCADHCQRLWDMMKVEGWEVDTLNANIDVTGIRMDGHQAWVPAA